MSFDIYRHSSEPMIIAAFFFASQCAIGEESIDCGVPASGEADPEPDRAPCSCNNNNIADKSLWNQVVSYCLSRGWVMECSRAC